jgi:hypothetical protein
VYALHWEPGIQQMLLGVPHEAVLEFGDMLAGVLEDPWNFQRIPTEPVGDHYAHRTVLFAEGRGMVTFLILEHAAEVHVTRIVWLG